MREDSDTTSKKRIIKNPKFTVFSAAAAAGFLALAGTAITGVFPGHYEAHTGEGEYTVLVYMVGSDLEGDYSAAGEDLKEMQEALAEAELSPEQVRIVVEAGGTPEWHCEPMQDKTYGRLYMNVKTAGAVRIKKNARKRKETRSCIFRRTF